MECVTIENVDDLPLKDKDRQKTDIFCCCFGALFAITMLTIAIAIMNTNNYKNTNFPTDSDGIPCAYGVNKKYPFVYFPNINDINTRVCLSSCPNSGDPQLSCRVNSVITSCDIPNIYSASVNFGRLGGFCAPNDQAAQKKLIQTANLSKKWNFMDIFDTIESSLLISLGMGIFWSLLVQFFPRGMASVVTILSVATLAVGGFIVLLDPVIGITKIQKLVMGVILLFLAILFTSFLCLYRTRTKLFTVFLDWSSRVLKQNALYLLYVFVFIVCTIGLIVLCLFQHIAYLSHSQPKPSNDDIFLKLTPNILLLVLNIIEFIWGLQFLKDSFNFILSGMAVEQYCQNGIGFFDTFLRLLKYHFGSVVGGSFLNAFFNIFNFILQTLRCHSSGVFPACAPCCDNFYDCHANFSELIRTDIYSYINITGLAYCNAARNCEFLIVQVNIFIGSQSVLYFYRISAYCFSVGVAVIASYFIQKQKLNGEVDLLSLAIATLFSYCVITYFIDLHANVAEGLQIIYMIQEVIGRSKKLNYSKGMNHFKQEIAQMKSFNKDGIISC